MNQYTFFLAIGLICANATTHGAQEFSYLEAATSRHAVGAGLGAAVITRFALRDNQYNYLWQVGAAFVAADAGVVGIKKVWHMKGEIERMDKLLKNPYHKTAQDAHTVTHSLLFNPNGSANVAFDRDRMGDMTKLIAATQSGK